MDVFVDNYFFENHQPSPLETLYEKDLNELRYKQTLLDLKNNYDNWDDCAKYYNKIKNKSCEQ